MGVPHPIPYQGSKRGLASAILAYFPHDVDRLIEPFAGSAAVSLAAASVGKAAAFILNDINAPLMYLWKQIVNDPDATADEYARIWHSQGADARAYYDDVRDRFNRSQQPTDLLFLLTRCVKAAVRSNAQGEFNQSPDNRRKGTHPATMRRHILGASAVLCGCTDILTGDYRDAVNDATSRDLIYLDPPYQGVSATRDGRYVSGLAFSALVEFLRDLNARRLSTIVSYDGRTGDKRHGEPLPEDLAMTRIEIRAGRSSQATLLGRGDLTYESLYLSPALVRRLGSIPRPVPGA